ncbi:TonB-dependent receptor [Vibrio sinensis]|uniref:TonB-dependent receptor n=1 Tax=Vibrio sinensis TaxID=2302434 RepID=A0A3A6Q4Q2_9VIBR|nr:TonB-dependent receptor [Vibrio sinensis]RJX64929.1 TonB-dependent receptor [Vibrio sinensis]
MNRSILAMSVASLLPYASFSQAQELSTDETVVVTASRFETQVSDTIAPIEVVTREEIDAIQAKSLSDILRRLPGIQVANQGGIGQGSELYIRGRSTKNTLVLFNGVRVGSATLGYANLSSMPIAGIERIEVLRGPRAAVHGSDAVSGVINIITARGQDASSSVKVGAGSFGSHEASANLATSSDNGAWMNISAAYQKSDGYNVQPESTTPDDIDKDGFDTHYLVLDVGKELTPDFMIKANGFYQKHNVEYDNPWVGTDQTDNELYSAAFIGEYKNDRLFSNVTLATNYDDATSYGQGVDASSISTSRYAASWDNKFQSSDSVSFVSGLDWYQDNVENESTAMTTDSRNNTALYIGSYLAQGDLSAELNLRWDDNSAYGSFTTYQLGADYKISDTLKIVGMYGTAFKAPSFNELYWPLRCTSWGCYSGNPDLEPEETQSAEIAIEATFMGADLRLGVYHSDVEKMIASNGVTQININEAAITGYELTGHFYTGPLSHSVSYDYLDTEDKSTGYELARRAKHNAKWNMMYVLEAWQFDLSYLYQGSRFDDQDNTTKLGAYSLVDIAASYYFANGLVVGAKVGNLFDENYETAENYKTPERNYYASVAYQF